jgi:hypothetical protein
VTNTLAYRKNWNLKWKLVYDFEFLARGRDAIIALLFYGILNEKLNPITLFGTI